MAADVNGLNEISSLDWHQDSPTMDNKKSGFGSRIPKFGFSFRRSATSATAKQQEQLPTALESDQSTGVKPVSNRSPSTVARSKSLRLPRTHHVKSLSSSAIHQEQKENGVCHESKLSYLKPKPVSKCGSSSTPSSRSSSPGLQMYIPNSQPHALTEIRDDLFEEDSSHFKRRSQSFSIRQPNLARNTVRARNHVKPNSAGRSKTPTASSRSADQQKPTSKSEPRNLPLTRTNSLGQIGKVGLNQSTPSPTPRGPMCRVDSSGSVSSLRNRGRRPSSVIMSEGAADLNKLAREINNSFHTSDTSEPEAKSARSITHSKIPTIKTETSPFDRQTTPSPTEKSIPKPYRHSTASSRAKHTPKNDVDKPLRPSSARANYIPPDSLTEANRSHSVARMTEETDGKLTISGRDSTPSSGRSSPVQSKGEEKPSRKSSIGDSNLVVGRVTGLPPRTPYRVARTRAVTLTGSDVAGINELAGSVLLEADDYRRISNEVKALKTMLFKLKREIQGEVEGSSVSISSSSSSSRTGRKGSPTSSGTSLNDLTKKLEQITAERDKAQQEASKCKKELISKGARIDQLTSKLQQAKVENGELSDKLQEMEAHRDHLLDKVERLHADKHKLDDKLNSLAKIRFYERTLSESTWLDELDGDDAEEREAERKETESDIGDSLMLSDGGEGESSEPESAAVCSAPIS